MSPTAATCTSASHPAVSKQWIFRFTIAGGTRDAGLGPYPTVSLVKAREEAEKYRRLVATGINAGWRPRPPGFWSRLLGRVR
jgi:Arm DNA-binding domain